MTPRLFVLTVTAALALAGSAVAAGYSSSTAGTTAPKATTQAQVPAGPTDTLTQKEMNAAMPLNKVSNPVSTLANAKVDDHQGHTFGPVKSVVTGETGAPTAIHVDIDGHIVSMAAKNLTYIPDRNILLTRMTKAQAEKLPAAKG